MLEAIVFDFDGVIVDTEPLHYRAFLEVMHHMGHSFDYETYLREYIGFDDRDAFRYAAQKLGRKLDHAELARLISDKAAAFERVVREDLKPFPGAVELIETAAAAMPIAIATGALKSDIELILPNLGGGGLPKLFTTIVTANDVERSKPDPESYAMAARRLNVPPQRCLAIEDTHAGLASARAAGLMTLAVGHSYPPQQLADFADRVASALSQVSLAQLQQWYG